MMALKLFRRLALAALCGSTVFLSACGSGSVASTLDPSRFVVFGDGFSDVGQTGRLYTVNDGADDIWPQRMANLYGIDTPKPASQGGSGYAVVNSRVTIKPDVVGNADTPTMEEQITAFLAKDSFGGGDVALVSAGIADLIAEYNATLTGQITEAQMVENARAIGRTLGEQAARLAQHSGAQHVLVAGIYDLSKSPLAIRAGKESLFSDASLRFNEGIKLAMADANLDGRQVLFYDTADMVNGIVYNPDAYRDPTTGTNLEWDVLNELACTSVDPNNSIGLGANEVNSGLCTAETAKSDYLSYVFADKVYLTPTVHRLLADYSRDFIRNNW